MPADAVRWTASTRTDQGPRRHMADAAHHFGRLAWAVADGIGDDYEPADAAVMAAQAAPYPALTGGAAHGIATARTVLQDHYQGCPRGQQGDCVMVTAMPMSQHVEGGWDFAWVGDCRANTVQNAALRQVTDDHTEGQKMRDWNDPYWAKIADSYDHVVTRALIAATRARRNGTDNIAVTVIAPRTT